MVKIERKDLTQAKVHEYFKYDDTLGELIWIKNTHPTKNLIGRIAGGISKRDSNKHIRFFGVLYRTHHLIWLYCKGTLPKYHIDHKDHNEQNNCISNLREVTSAENNKNQSKRKDNTTGVVGVWIEKRRKSTKYVAEIMVNKKKIHLGTFNTLDEAKLARTNAEYKYDFHINHGIDKPL